MDRRRGCEAQVNGRKALARSDRPRTGAASRIGFDQGQRTKFVPGLSPASAKARQHGPWPSRDGATMGRYLLAGLAAVGLANCGPTLSDPLARTSRWLCHPVSPVVLLGEQVCP